VQIDEPFYSRDQLSERMTGCKVDWRRRSKSTKWWLNGAQLPFGYEGPVSVIEPPLIAVK